MSNRRLALRPQIWLALALSLTLHVLIVPLMFVGWVIYAVCEMLDDKLSRLEKQFGKQCWESKEQP